MLTSRQLIKENEIKHGSVKFYEEELRKLRALILKLEKDREQVESALAEQLAEAREQLRVLAEANRTNSLETARLQEQYECALEEKDT